MNLLRRRWRPLLEKAGLRRIRFHDLRHTHASPLIQRGEPLAYVKDRLGHHDPSHRGSLWGTSHQERIEALLIAWPPQPAASFMQPAMESARSNAR
jgi:integrase